MEYHWSVWGLVAGGLAAVALSTVRLVLNGLSGGRLRRLERSDPGLARRLVPSLEQRDEYRVLLRLLLTLAVVLMLFCVARGACSSAPAIGLSPWQWGGILLGGMVFLVVSEGLGRYLGVTASAQVLVVALPALRGCRWLLFPLAEPVLALHRAANRWREARCEEDEEVTAEDEIMSLLDQEAESGGEDAGIDPEERRMIRGIFDLGDTTVGEILTPRVDVEAIDERVDIQAVKALIVACGHSRIPVYRDTIDHVVGIVYAKDLLDDRRTASAATIGELLHPPMLIPESKRVSDLLNEFRQTRSHIAVVLDEYGGTAGIVTIEDILEEIVGEIRDEYDAEEAVSAAQVLPDGTMIVDARTSVEDVNEALGADLPTHDDYDTVGGYISAQAGRIPQAGEVVMTEHLRAQILEADPRRILKAQVTVRRDADGDTEAS